MRTLLIALALILFVPQAEAKVRHHGAENGPKHHRHHNQHIAKKKFHGVSPSEELLGSIEPQPLPEIDNYLYEVYQRAPTKVDSSGDFTWKDKAAAERRGLSLQDYVIGGMSTAFRQLLYKAGQALDKAGLNWAILSAFRDDYRQSIASGFKAAVGFSRHGGSHYGGFGHGQAIDITAVGDTKIEDVIAWLDNHREYGLVRPMKSNDPLHVQAGDSSNPVARTRHVGYSHRHGSHRHKKRT